MSEDRRTLDLKEAAHALGVNYETLRQAASRGEIHVIRIGRRILVPRWVIDDMLGLPKSGSKPAES